jgi:Tfp pilus assembly protein PilN
MVKINFMPDEYVESNESRRINFIYLTLLALVVASLGGLIVAITIRKQAFAVEEKIINQKMAKVQEGIRKSEEFHEKRKVMMETAMTTAELFEPVPRSILLALLTNQLPPGVSFLDLSLIQQEQSIAATSQTPTKTKYDIEQELKAAAKKPQVSPENMLETLITIEGIAPSDLEVASYIERLSDSPLLDDVALVESTESKSSAKQNSKNEYMTDSFKKFKLTAKLKNNIEITKENVNQIKVRL